MCGITGGFIKKGLNPEIAQRITDTLAHRGPDASGVYLNEEQTIFLGHRRLSILDLSTVANQPMTSSNGRYKMVYNGEVYNFAALKDKLPGHPWKTNSDTEVILELFARFGTRSFAWLNGMFAIAIIDTREEVLYLVRDHAGIKPLFYYRDDDNFLFASELKAIQRGCQALGLPLRIERSIVPVFLHLGFVPGIWTIFERCIKFQPGSIVSLDLQHNIMNTSGFWTAKDHYLTSPVKDEASAFRSYKDTLFAAVKDQMVSDVPLGTFLSGGVDSSLVTAVAAQVAPGKVKSFSIGFEEPRYDESAHAAAVAAHLKTDHHCFRVSAADVLDLVPSLVQAYDEPFADSSAFPTMLVSRLARQHVTVALSGDGGDELFQGYGMYTWANRLNQPIYKYLRKPAYALTRLMNDRMKRGGRLFNYPAPSRIFSHIFSQEQYYFSEQELKALVPDGQSFDFSYLGSMFIPDRGNAAEKQAYWDFNHYLQDDLLVKVDRASMQYSLETRVPLLDLRLIEMALNISYELKVSPELGRKHLMKKTLYELVPRHLIDRPKRGFAIPLKEWLRGPLKPMIREYLNSQHIDAAGFVRADKVAQLIRRFEKGEDHLYNRIWTLIVLHWWWKENNI